VLKIRVLRYDVDARVKVKCWFDHVCEQTESVCCVCVPASSFGAGARAMVVKSKGSLNQT
jgi:hypothetical protein